MQRSFLDLRNWKLIFSFFFTIAEKNHNMFINNKSIYWDELNMLLCKYGFLYYGQP